MLKINNKKLTQITRTKKIKIDSINLIVILN